MFACNTPLTGLLALASLLLLIACGSATVAGPTDLEGRATEAVDADARATVLIFVDPHCPVANAMAPEIERLRRRFEPQDLRFRLIYPDGGLESSVITTHLEEYGLGATPLRDPGHVLVERYGATISPEAVVVVDGVTAYRGRIDDRAIELGAGRVQPRHRDLELALEAVLAGREPDPARTVAVGCELADLRTEPRAR